MATPAALEIRDLSVVYPASDRDALRAVTVEVQAGEVLSLAGRNGAGKSTLCLAAAGLLPRVVRASARGWVTVAGSVAMAAGRAGDPVVAALVLADPAAGLSGARASVRAEVAFGLENLGIPRSAMAARIDEALAALGIEALADAAPERLSGGEQQRLAIAAGLAMSTPLLVLDEASAELDPAGAADLAAILAGVAIRGTAVLAADHAAAILGAADRVLVLDDGAIATLGTPAVALEHPALTGDGAPPPTWTPVRNRPAVPVELRDVSFRYPGGAEALRGVSIRIEPGQAVAIVGANGSGKSTLAKHLIGLLRPADGRVEVDGRDLAATSVDEVARVVGFLFQDPRDQLFGRTVEAAIAFGPRNLGFAPEVVRTAVDEALAATGLSQRRATNPHDLDLAARKQVALASVLAMDPAVYVLDEPTTGQDVPGLARVEAVLGGLRAAGRTIVAITHDLGFAARAFDRVVVLRSGEVVDDGSPSRVLAEGNTPLLVRAGLRPARPA